MSNGSEHFLVRIARFLVAPNNQMTNEKSQTFIKGSAADIKALSKLDSKIGKVLRAYHGQQDFIPNEAVDKVKAEVKRHSEIFNRVTAYVPYEESLLEMTARNMRSNEAGRTETPVSRLEYVHNFTSKSGNDIEQRVASFRVGR